MTLLFTCAFISLLIVTYKLGIENRKNELLIKSIAGIMKQNNMREFSIELEDYIFRIQVPSVDENE